MIWMHSLAKTASTPHPDRRRHRCETVVNMKNFIPIGRFKGGASTTSSVGLSAAAHSVAYASALATVLEVVAC
jgi:hypothetical protein